MNQISKYIKNAIKTRDLKNKIFCYLLMKMGYSNIKIQAMEIRNKKWKKFSREYKNVLNKINYEKENYNKEGTDNIWICWFQGEKNAPHIVKKCIESIKKYNKDKKIHIITQENISEYVELPNYIYEKWKKGIITNTHLSDLLRLELLIRYGGLWIDATTLLTGQIPGDIFEKNLFMFHFKNIEDITIKSNNWLIFAVKDCRLLKVTRDLLYHYWRKENIAKNYFIFHFFMSMAIEKYPEDWENVFYITDDIAHTLAYNLYRKFDVKDWEKLIQITPIHKLTYKIDNDRNLKDTYYEYIIKEGV